MVGGVGLARAGGGLTKKAADGILRKWITGANEQRESTKKRINRRLKI